MMDETKKQNVYGKLLQTREDILGKNLKMGGRNNYSNYSYYELSDFIPSVIASFKKNGLIAIVSYTAETATMTITDTDDPKGQTIVIASPMPSVSESTTKGQQPIQTLGALETYERRYLYLSALDLVETDEVEALRKKEDEEGKEERSFFRGTTETPQPKTDYHALIQEQTKRFGPGEYDRYQKWLDAKFHVTDQNAVTDESSLKTILVCATAVANSMPKGGK